MNPPLVVMDIGDVLIRTVPTAHYRELARRTGMAWEQVADTIESSGIVAAFERGQLTAAGFANAVRRLLSRPGLRTKEVEEAWNVVVAEPDPVLAPVAACLAAAGRLLLASNTNPFHWRLVRGRLAGVGINAPACLSFEIGCTKPDPKSLPAPRKPLAVRGKPAVRPRLYHHLYRLRRLRPIRLLRPASTRQRARTRHRRHSRLA